MDLKAVRGACEGHAFEQIISPGARSAAVMFPVTEDASGKCCLLFEVRSPKIIQGGEICLPGGRVEDGESPARAVIRESAEELLLEEKQIRLTAPMFTMYGAGGAYIYSYLAELEGYRGTFSPEEVESVFLLPVDELLEMEPLVCTAPYTAELPEDFPYHLIPGGRNYPWRKRLRRYYFYETRFGVIWGMTGELVYHFLQFLKKNSP